MQAVVIALLVVGWEALSRGELVDPRLLPPASVVGAALADMLGDPRVLRHLWVTIAEVLVAFAAVAPVGVGLGLLLGEHDYLGRAFKPFFYFIASVPKSVFLPIFILLFGIGFVQKVAFGVFQAIFVLVISSIAAVTSVPAERVRVARAFGATSWQVYTQIYWPSMLPLILEGVRLGLIFNITGVIFAEMYVSRAGLGVLIARAGQSFQMPDLFAGIVLTAILSIVVNEALRWYERRVGRWRA